MGNKSTKTSIGPFLMKYVSEFSYDKTLNKNYIYNSVLADIENEGPIICKMYFVKDKATLNNLQEQIMGEIEKMDEMFHLHSCPNILPYSSWEVRRLWILILRQYMYQNLKTKINQKLEMVEKKWLTFQLLNAVSQLHSRAITHGDIKPENIVLTSSNWLFLTDFLTLENVYDISGSSETEKRFVNYKPTYVKEDNWKIYNMFFGDLDNNKRCYIAPERCLNNIEYSQKTIGDYMVQPSMDVFSVGWVIAEIFLDGKPLFDLAKHQRYRKGDFNPMEVLYLIGDDEIESLIMSMIKLDPQERKSIDAYRQDWMKVFPKSFKCILFQLGSCMLRENIILSDERISMIRKYFDAAWMAFNGEELEPHDLLVPTNPKIFEYLKFENFPNIITDLYPDYDCIISHKNNGERNIEKLIFKTDSEKNAANDSALILILMIGTFLISSRYPDSKIMAIEMLKCLGKQIRNEYRLQYVIPYCISCFTDDVSKVRVAAIDTVIEVLQDWEFIKIGHTDYYVFDTYIYPAFLKLLDDKDKVIQLKFIEKIPYLVNIGKMLITSVNKQEITNLAKDEQNTPEVNKEQREECLFARLEEEVPLEKEAPYHIEKYDYDDSVDPNISTDQTLSQNHEDVKEEIKISTSKSILEESEKNNQEYMKSIMGNENIIIWNRKRFFTDEQRTRSVLALGYNMPLNDNDSDLSEDIDQENEVEREFEALKEKIIEVVERIIDEQDVQNNYILMCNIEQIAEFLGENVISESLLPYVLSIPNMKDSRLTLVTLKALRVLSHYVIGVNELKYIVTSCDNLFYDPNEVIALEALSTVTYIAKQHQNVFDNTEICLNMIRKLINFWLHPWALLRNQAVKWISLLIKNKHVSFLYWNVLPLVRNFLSSPTILKMKTEKDFKNYLDVHISRFWFELATSKITFKLNFCWTFSLQDRHALILIQEMIDNIQKPQQNKSSVEFKNLPVNLSGYTPRKVLSLEDFKDDLNDPSRYVERYYYPKRVEDKNFDIKRNETNYGLNERQRHPKMSAHAFYNQTLYYSLKGFEVVDNNMKNTASQSQIIKRSVDTYTDEQSALWNWQPRGRLINTIQLDDHNKFPDPVNTIVTSNDSTVLISGSKHGKLHYFKVDDSESEIKVDLVETVLITDFDNSKQINSISIINEEHSFWVGMDEGTIDIYASSSSHKDNIGLIHRISRPDEGHVTKTCDFRKPFNTENVFVYTTQKGFMHIHDMRVKLDVTTYELGMKYGMPNALITSNIQSYNRLLVGTLGGFIHIFDIRYNIPMVIYEHSQNHPILDLCMYYPNKKYKYKMFSENNEYDLEHCIIATAGSIAPHNERSSHETPQCLHEVCIMDVYLGEMKSTYTVDDTMNESIEPVEVPEFYAHDPIKLSKTNWSSRFLDNIHGWFGANYVTKILCPTLSGANQSVPYFITSSTDRKIRYWNVVKDKRYNNYNISTPTDNESKYKDFYLGDIQAVQEKVYEDTIDTVNLNTTVSYLKKRKTALSSKSNIDPYSAVNEGLYSQDKGISSCQPFNACHFTNINDSYDIHGKNYQNSAHADAVLDLSYIDSETLGPYLVSSGRDGVIKIWN